MSLNPKAKMEPFPIKIDLRRKRIGDIVSYMYDITSNDLPVEETKNEKVKSQSKNNDPKPRSKSARSKKLQELLDRNRL